MSAGRSPLAPLVAAGIGGFLLWALAPALAGVREPWDAAGPFYSVGMVLMGAAQGLAWPGRPFAAALGLWLGQVAAFALLPGADLGWLPLGVITTAVGSTIGVVAALAGWGLRRALARA